MALLSLNHSRGQVPIRLQGVAGAQGGAEVLGGVGEGQGGGRNQNDFGGTGQLPGENPRGQEGKGLLVRLGRLKR